MPDEEELNEEEETELNSDEPEMLPEPEDFEGDGDTPPPEPPNEDVAAVVGEVGVKETAELLDAVMAIAIIIIGEVKDGIGVRDFFAVMDQLKNNSRLRRRVEEGIKGITEVPDEIKDLKVAEIPELTEIIQRNLQGVIDAIAAEKVVI